MASRGFSTGQHGRSSSQTFCELFKPSLDGRSFYLVNQAYMILLHKKIDAATIGDYRPISLIHSFAKLFTKVLARRLAPHMNGLVMHNQSAFI